MQLFSYFKVNLVAVYYYESVRWRQLHTMGAKDILK